MGREVGADQEGDERDKKRVACGKEEQRMEERRVSILMIRISISSRADPSGPRETCQQEMSQIRKERHPFPCDGLRDAA